MTTCQTNGVTTTGCSWNRKLRLSCHYNGTDVNLRVQSNSLPDHCFLRGSSSFPVENNIDFTVKYNVAPTAITTNTINSTSNAESILCRNNWSNAKMMKINQASVNVVEDSGMNNNIVGVLLNGVPLFSGLSDNINYDALQSYIAGTSGATNLDQCLGGYNAYGFYHYYSYSPCILDSLIKSATTPSTCLSANACKLSPFTYATSNALVAQKVQKVVGVAKDGHGILGPFKSDGSLWQQCEVDACNGVTIGGKYYYVLTSFYPYTIGCWGPASTTSYSLSCTTNERVSCP
jgi:hypothetical protein